MASKRTCKCAYCQATNVVQQMRTLSEITPADWSAPRVWTPPEGFAVSGELTRRAGFAVLGVAGSVAIVVVLGVVTMCLLPVAFIVVMWALDPDARNEPLITGPGFDDAVFVSPSSE
ncbi:MAG: hypothetical protein AB8I08_03915 [Sandaracinaceae bacterium]